MIKRKLGFTLVEILVVLTLIAILGGVGIVGYRDAARRQTVEAAAGKLTAALRKAQVNAAAGVKDVTACGGLALKGWQVQIDATSYTISGVCGAATLFGSITENYSNSTVVTVLTFPSPNPILFKVLNQGTNVTATTGIALSGFGNIQGVTITGSGEVKGNTTVPTPTPFSSPTPTPSIGPTPTPTPTTVPTPTPTPTPTPPVCSGSGGICGSSKGKVCCPGLVCSSQTSGICFEVQGL